jgi:hypothetical protein
VSSLDISQERLRLIDINCYYGFWPDSTIPLHGKSQIERHLDKGFDYVCLTSTKAIFLNSQQGNDEIVRLAHDDQRIIPVIVLPHHLEDNYRIDTYIDQNINIFRCISLGNIRNHPWMETIAEKKAILLLTYDSAFNTAIPKIASSFPEIRFVLSGVNYPQLEELLGVLAMSPNVYIEISHFQLCSGIEFLCRRIGPEKVIFGTNSPVFTAESSLLKLRNADITDNTRELISYLNLTRCGESVPNDY